MTRIAIAELERAAANREPGYFDHVVARGKVDGAFLVIDLKEYQRLFRETRGLGDWVAVFAQPVAGAIDATLGTRISDCPSCATRREFLNELFRR